MHKSRGACTRDKVLSGIQTPAIIPQSHFRLLRLCKHLCICFINLALKAVHCLGQLELCGLCATRSNCNIMFTKILYPTAPGSGFHGLSIKVAYLFLEQVENLVHVNTGPLASGLCSPASLQPLASGLWPLASALIQPPSCLWSLASSSPLEKTEPWASGWSHTL